MTNTVDRYRSCMARNLSDIKTITPTEKKIHFAMSAKICSDKARNPDEAYIFVRREHPEWFTEDKQEYIDIFKRFNVEKE